MHANRGKLTLMMFLTYVVWGSWLPLLTLYMGALNFEEYQKAWMMNAFAIAAMVGFLFGGQLADRTFAQERYLAFSHLVGGVAMLLLATRRDFGSMMALMMVHCLFFVPTLSVANGIAFANLADPKRDFGLVRLGGTLGWIAAAFPFMFIPTDWAKVDATNPTSFVARLGAALAAGNQKQGDALISALANMFTIAGVVSLVLAAFCLLLPHTPPAKREGEAFAPLEALKVLRVPAILVLFVVTFFDSVVQFGYFYWTAPFFKALGLGENWIPVAMSVGQIAEIPAMALLGLILTRFGWRNTMIFGVAAQVLRFGFYLLGAHQGPSLLWLVIAGNILHGFGYACFFATVYIFVDENFPKDVRNSAQSLFNLLILGVGQFASNFFSSWLGTRFRTPKLDAAGAAVLGTDGQPAYVPIFTQVFPWIVGLAILATLVLALFFHPAEKAAPPSGELAHA